MKANMGQSRMKILVLDGQNQNTLAIVRHLGPIHIIHVAGAKKFCLSFFSRYAKKRIVIADPKKNPDGFVKQLKAVLEGENYDLLMPVGFRSYQLCAQHQESLRKLTNLILTSSDNIELASDKHATYSLAEEIGVPYPKTYPIQEVSDFEKLELNFPLVIKFPFESGKNVVEYAYDINSARKLFSTMIEMNSGPRKALPIVQEYIVGDGYGFFAYYDQGVCKRTFMHHRIREYPVTGGASVCAESFSDGELFRYGKKLLDHLKWDGVAMVEFKKDNKDGKYKLMEINPKFWGSLELAIESGVNFPSMLADRARGKEVEESNRFNQVTFHWIINGELFHFLSRPSSIVKIFQSMKKSKSDFRIADIKPNLFQVLNIFVHYYKKITNR